MTPAAPSFPSRCLVCCEGLASDDPRDYHARCSRTLFDRPQPPDVDLGMDDIERLAREKINRRVAVTGVQRKISLDLAENESGRRYRLTFVGLLGRFVHHSPGARLRPAGYPVVASRRR